MRSEHSFSHMKRSPGTCDTGSDSLQIKKRESLVLTHFGVMLCQTSFFVGVEYHKSTLPQQKIRLPRLTPNCIQYLIAQTEPVPNRLGRKNVKYLIFFGLKIA